MVRVIVRVRARFEVGIRVRVPNLNPNRMYVTGGKCKWGVSFLEPGKKNNVIKKHFCE